MIDWKAVYNEVVRPLRDALEKFSTVHAKILEGKLFEYSCIKAPPNQ